MPTESSQKMEPLEERVKNVASILVEWNINEMATYDHCGALYRISKILKPEFLQAWNEYLTLQRMKRKAIAPLIIKSARWKNE